MMKKINSLTILFLTTVVMLVLMLITLQAPSENNDDNVVLFPELFEQLSVVDTLEFKSNQDEFTLYKEGEDWFVKEHWGYPADFNLVKRALIDIAEAKILERKTDNPDEFYILGVEGIEDGGSSIQISMIGEQQQVAGLILGKERELNQTGGARQFYVRRAGENNSWLAEGYLNLTPVMLNWIKSEVIDIARERIAQVNIIQPYGAGTATIVNTGNKDQFGTPEALDKTVFKYKQLGYDIAGSLFQLKLEDVQPRSEFLRGSVDVVEAEFITFDGLKVITKTSFDDGHYFTTISAEYDASLIKVAPEDIQALELLKTPEQVQAEVAELNTQLSPWVYRFAGFIGTNLMRAKEDMVTESNKVIPMPADVTGGFGS